MMKNWFWMHPPRDFELDDWKALFDQCAQNGVHGVFLQAYNGSTCYFEHPTLTVEKPLLEVLAPLAREHGVELHAWMWTMICNNPTIVAEHPDWYVLNGRGERADTQPAYVPYYRFMCARHEGVREFVQSTVCALSAIDGLAGVHLDYVRQPDSILAEALQPKYDIVQDKEYPEYDYCYDDQCTRPFREATGIEPRTGLKGEDYDRWLQYRMDGTSELVNDYLAPIARDAGKMITAAVFPNWISVRQQWNAWDLDAFFPMLYNGFYNEDHAWIYRQTRELRGLQRFGRPVFSGLFLADVTATDLPTVMEGCVEAGASGVSLFDYDGFSDGTWEALARSGA